MAGPIPTKKIPQLTALGAPLQGVEQLEIWVVNTSRRITARDFVLPIDALITLTGMGGTLPGARQLVSSPTIEVVDNGAGSTVQLNGLGTGALPGNPTALVGLTPINGVAANWMRSDAAPALNQGIAPTWTAMHTFAATSPAISVENVTPRVQLWETDAAADNRKWWTQAQGEQLSMLAMSDDLLSSNAWAVVDRTGIVIDTVNFQATIVQVNGVNVRDATNLFNIGTVPTARLGSGVADATSWLRGDQTWQLLPGGFTGFANPTASVGLAAVNGVAVTAMRSDAAPALSQAIAPTWTAQHIFSLTGATNAAILASSAQPQVDWDETDAAANNRRWRWEAQGEQFLGRMVNDANSAAVTWILVDRTLNVADLIALTSTALTWNGNALLSTATAFANPTASVGLAAVNGVATTAMRSDAAPALSVSINPNWSGSHTFTAAGNGNITTPVDIGSTQPQFNFRETDAAADNQVWVFNVNSEQLRFRISNDAGSVTTDWLTVDRTGATIDNVTFPAQTVFSLMASGLAFPVQITSNLPGWQLTESDAAANNRIWQFYAASEDLFFDAVTDVGAGATWMRVARTAGVVDSVRFPTITTGSFSVGAVPGTSMAMGHVYNTAGHALSAIVDVVSDIPLRTWNRATAGNNVFEEFYTEAAPSARGSITYNRGGGLVVYNTTSDERLKTNIVDAPEASNLIDQIRIRSFDWKESGTHLEHWMVAQELYQVVPFAVSPGDNDRHWGVDPSKLVPLVIKELQSVRRRLQALEQNDEI